MAETDSKRLIVWVYMHTATQLMHFAQDMIFDALWKANEIDSDESDGDDLAGVNKPLDKLMNDARKLTENIERETKKLSPLDDEKPTNHNNKKEENHE